MRHLNNIQKLPESCIPYSTNHSHNVSDVKALWLYKDKNDEKLLKSACFVASQRQSSFYSMHFNLFNFRENCAMKRPLSKRFAISFSSIDISILLIFHFISVIPVDFINNPSQCSVFHILLPKVL